MISRKEKSCGHIQIVSTIVIRILFLYFCFETCRIAALFCNTFQRFQIVDLSLCVFQILRCVVRSQDQIVALCNIITKLCNDSVSVICSGNNRVTVVTEHMGINCIDLWYLHIKCFGSLMNDKVYAADIDLAFTDYIGNLMNRVVKNCAKCMGEVGDQSFSATVFGVFHSVLRCGRNVAPAP